MEGRLSGPSSTHDAGCCSRLARSADCRPIPSDDKLCSGCSRFNLRARFIDGLYRILYNDPGHGKSRRDMAGRSMQETLLSPSEQERPEGIPRVEDLK
jgi:hypothetical protein